MFLNLIWSFLHSLLGPCPHCLSVPCGECGRPLDPESGTVCDDCGSVLDMAFRAGE